MTEKFLKDQKVSMFYIKTDFLFFKNRFQYWNSMWKIFPWIKMKKKTGNNPILLSYESGIVNVIAQKCSKNVSDVKNVFQ